MPPPSDRLADWTVHTNHVENERTFILVHHASVRHPTPLTAAVAAVATNPASLVRDFLGAGSGRYYLIPYTPLGGHHVHFTQTAAMYARQQERVRLRAGDVCVMPYPRSGCTWAETIVLLLLARGDGDALDIAHKNAYIPPARAGAGGRGRSVGKILADTLFHDVPKGVDVCAPWGSVCGQAHPYTAAEVDAMDIHPVHHRVFKSHMPVSLALRGARGEPPPAAGAKYVMWMRDPKDAAVSLYRVNSLNLAALGVPFTPFIKLFVEGKAYLPHWLTYHVEWLRVAREHPDQFLVLTYEAALQKPRETVEKVAAFLGIDVGDEMLDECVRLSSFHSMKEKAKTADAEHIHVGKAGGWREWMTKEMVVAFNDMLDDDRLGIYRAMYTVDVDAEF